MNRRNGNWLALSINQLTATAVTDLAALSGYRSIKPAALHPTRRRAERRFSERNCGRSIVAYCAVHPAVCRCYTLCPKNTGRPERSATPQSLASRFPFGFSPSTAASASGEVAVFCTGMFFVRWRHSRSFDRIKGPWNVARFSSSILARSPIDSGSAFSS
jgi:hypothetical protein